MKNTVTKQSFRRGLVQDVQYTQGGAGNQWTKIDGVKYATYWDIRTAKWRVGDVVEYRTYMAPLWSGQPNIPHAHILPQPVGRIVPSLVE